MGPASFFFFRGEREFLYSTPGIQGWAGTSRVYLWCNAQLSFENGHTAIYL